MSLLDSKQTLKQKIIDAGKRARDFENIDLALDAYAEDITEAIYNFVKSANGNYKPSSLQADTTTGVIISTGPDGIIELT